MAEVGNHTQFAVHSLIPNLYNEKGHQFIYHVALKEAVEKLNWSHTAWVLKTCTISPLPLNWKNFFSKKHALKIDIKGSLVRFIEFSKLFREKEPHSRLFFMESFNTSDLCAFTLAALLLSRKKDIFSILFRYDFQQLCFGGWVHRILAKALSTRLEKRFVLLTDSETIAKKALLFHLPISVVPIPHTTHLHQQFTSKSISSLTCWWPGEPRPSKGLSYIKKLFSIKDPSVDQFHLYLSEEASLSDASSFLKLHYLPHVLPRDLYVHQLLTSHFIFLPYDPTIYRSSTSGIFIESICAGVIPIVSEGTWMADELKIFGLEELVVDWSDPLFFTYLSTYWKNATLLSKLKKMQSHYRQFHHVDHFSVVFHRLFNDLC